MWAGKQYKCTPFPLQYESEEDTDGSSGHPRTTAQDLCVGGDELLGGITLSASIQPLELMP